MQADLSIVVTVKEVYGVAQVYPANEAARLLAQIAGTKTLTRQTLALAKRMGFVVTEQSARSPILDLLAVA